MLLDSGALVCASTRGYGFPGIIPLHFAVCGGSLDCVQELLALGADRLHRDSSGRIPYMVALRHKHAAYAALLNPSATDPLIWPSPLKFITELNPEAKALLERALMETNKEREKTILKATVYSLPSPLHFEAAASDNMSEIYALEDGKARSMWEKIGGQISILSPDRYGHIDWSIFEGIIVNSLEAKEAISRYVRRIAFEGGLVVDPDQGEFLCPVCHGLANSALPALPGDSQKVSRPPMVSTVSWPDATCQLSSANRETDFLRFQEALSLLRSAADVAGRSEILKAFPMHRNGRIRPNPESMFRVLSGMYFPG